MTLNELFAGNLKGTLDMLKMHLGDLSDADLMKRPVPNANHANWQIGHLLISEVFLTSKCGAPIVELPAGFADRYSKETAKIDDLSKFATKAELIAQFEKVRAGTIAWVKTLTPAQFAAPGPMPDFMPTVADLCAMASGHVWMHCGQIQVIRRSLGKPVLF